MDQNIVETIAQSLGIKAGKLRLEDVQRKLPELRRKVQSYEDQTIAAEKEALALKARAFLPETPASERAGLMQRASEAAKRAKQNAAFTETFLTQLGSFSSLETTMKITGQMKDAGLFTSSASTIDWQKAIDDMQFEIDKLTEFSSNLSHAMSTALSLGSDASSSVETDELEELFKQWEREPDPVKKEEIRKQIDKKTQLDII